jgi:heme-degrading monooxygenase HmoA
MAAEHLILWEYRVRAGRQDEFISVYGPDGEWARLFRLAEGYLGTELARSVSDPQVFFTLDRWSSEAAFDAFQSRHSAEYKALDEKCADLTEHEHRLGIMRPD